MYEAAQAEGGRLIVYAGGDTPDQQDYAKNGFKARFPNIDIDIIVDYSRTHRSH
jgi:putative oligopeptide ABC transporter, oligopeptide-binding protein